MSALFLQIVNKSLSAGWLILTVLLLRLLFRKAPKWITMLFWAIVALRLICPFSVKSPVSLIPSAETVNPHILTDSSLEIHTGIAFLNNAVNTARSHFSAPSPKDSANPLQIWIPVLSCVWAAGVVLLLVWAAVSCLRLYGKVRAAVLLRENIYQCETVVSPFVLGIVRPKIYLPFRINEADMALIIAHEQAHIRRKDHWWKPLGFLLFAVYWFHPLMWLAYLLFCRDIEFACDEKIIKAWDTDKRADYAQTLLTCSIKRNAVSACPLAFGENGIKSRIRSVLNYKKPAFWVMIAATAACIVVAVCFLTDPKDTSVDPVAENGGNNITEDTALQTPASAGAKEPFQPEGTITQEMIGERASVIYEKTPEAQIDQTFDDHEPVISKTHFQTDDGLWHAEGYTYQYRLAITGRQGNAAKDTTFYVLSNKKNLSYYETFMASGFSSNMNDYFDPEDAVIVGIRLY